MEKQFIIIGSITYTMKAKEILQRHGISSYIQKFPSKKTGIGCTYGLTIPKRIDDAYSILLQSGISIITASGVKNANDLS